MKKKTKRTRDYYKMKIQNAPTHDEDDTHRPTDRFFVIEINFNSEFVAIVWLGMERH